MALAVTKADAKRAISRYEALRGKIDRIKDKAEAKVGEAIHAAEVVGSAFAIGLVEGRTGGVELFNVPMPLLAGVAGLGLGLMDVAGKASSHVTAVGTGALAAYAATMGRGLGNEMRSKSEGGQAAVSGGAAQFIGAGRGGLSAVEILAAQRQAAQAAGG